MIKEVPEPPRSGQGTNGKNTCSLVSGVRIKKLALVPSTLGTTQKLGHNAVIALLAAGKREISESDVYRLLSNYRYRRSLSMSSLREYARLHSGYRLVLKNSEWYLVTV
jgi:hypothetical protein